MTEGKDPPKISLTISLLKEGVSKPNEIFRAPVALGALVIGHGRGSVGTLYYKASARTKPSWLKLFEPVLPSVPPSLRNSTTAGALIVKRVSRNFAVTFGLGRHLLAPGTIEDTFGLRVTLNSIDRDGIRSIDRQTFDAIASHTRSQSSRDASADQFGLDVQRDLVRAVTGTPRDKSLGNRISGADSLTVRIAADVSGIPKLLDRYFERYQSTDYKSAFPWLDQIRLVKNENLKNELDGLLLAALQTEDFGNAFLAVPEVIDWAQVSGFRYTEAGDQFDDVHLRDFEASLREGVGLSLAVLHRRRVRCIGKDLDQVTHKWPVFNCLNFEVHHREDRYLLASGRWYKVARSFVDQINDEVARVPLCAVSLPSYSDSDEAAYNQRVATASAGSFALMDDVSIVHGGGSSRIEFCDLYGSDGRVVHVKRYGGSQPLSHLFAQGLVSARLFLSDRDFRRKLNGKLPPSHRLGSTDAAPSPENFEIVFGIISRSAKPLPLSLPFFSRVTLATVYQQLALFRVKVSITKIPVAAGSTPVRRANT